MKKVLNYLKANWKDCILYLLLLCAVISMINSLITSPYKFIKVCSVIPVIAAIIVYVYSLIVKHKNNKK